MFSLDQRPQLWEARDCRHRVSRPCRICSPANGGVSYFWVWRSPGGGESDHPIRNDHASGANRAAATKLSRGERHVAIGSAVLVHHMRAAGVAAPHDVVIGIGCDITGHALADDKETRLHGRPVDEM